ncbi:MAG: 16S rRNA (guanine(527)-N(7))-methyltransferase RsmG [Bacteroidota bacterium]
MEIILKYFPDLSEVQKKQFELLYSLYEEWNSKINVISRKDIQNLYERHVLHSLGISKVISFPEKADVMDVGTGGGFPGLPLAILFPECHFHLVDSVGKKLKVIGNIGDSIGLKNIKTHHSRVEDLNLKVDYVVSRAVAVLKTFTFWVDKRIVQKNDSIINRGIYYLKGDTLNEELKVYKGSHQITNLSDFFDEEFFKTKKVIYLPR